MKPEDLSRCLYFTSQEIEATGASLQDVQIETILALDKFRFSIGRKVLLAFNGLTTGNHSSHEHKLGLAVDVYLDKSEGNVDNWAMTRAYVFEAIKAGFTGIGVYWNGVQYSFHFDLGAIRLWAGVKSAPGKTNWSYKTLLIDPRSYM